MSTSLRTRRPTQRVPKASGQAQPRTATARPRQSRIDDKIKRRMSMRYANIAGPEDVPDMPSMPSGIASSKGPSQAGGTRRDEGPDTRNPRAVDIKILDKDDFNPDAYLKVKLANSTESEIKGLTASLEAAKLSSSDEIKKSVVKNYAEFFTLAKEISTLENDLLELKESLAEWKAMPSLLTIDENAPIARQRANRSSVADLRVLYANQITALHQRIEGSSKFVPATPGRHIVSETTDITSLNAATYKPEQNVHFVLLDDALLVARLRKRRDEREDRLVALRCWNLSDIVVLDLKDTSDLSNAFKIKDGKNVHVFKTKQLSDKRGLFSSFKEVAGEFAARKRKQREEEHERRRSVWTGGDKASLLAGGSSGVPVPNLPLWLKDMSENDPRDAKGRLEGDLRRANEITDNLAVAISQRDWDEAIQLVDLAESQTRVLPSLASKLPSLKTSLTRALLEALADPTHRKHAVVHLTSLLIHLGAGVAARTTFLATRTELLRKRIRMISFEGDTAVYISDLAIVVFTTVKHSADWYFGSFREHESASTFVQWAKEQIQIYIDMFRTQVYNSDVSQKTVDDCLQITIQQSRRLLGENGLDFAFLLEQIAAPPQDPRSSTYMRNRMSINRATEFGARSNVIPAAVPRKPRNLGVPPRSRDRPGSIIDRDSNIVVTPPPSSDLYF